MNFIEIYLKAVKEIVPQDFQWLFNERSTTLTMASFDKDSKIFQFRFDTKLPWASYPVAQYVTMGCDGVMKFRNLYAWFVPTPASDVMYNSFENAKYFAELL